MADIFAMKFSWLISLRWNHHGGYDYDEIIIVDIFTMRS